MKITKTKDNLIIKVPLYQNSYDAVGTLQGEVLNIVGVIAGDEIGFSYLIDLGYKDSTQEGEMFLKFDQGKEEFIKLCEELKIPVWEHELCDYCGKVIYGCFFWGKKGAMCSECYNKESIKELEDCSDLDTNEV